MSEAIRRDEEQREQIQRLALKHRAEIWAFLIGLAKDPDKAEDLFQNTYLVIFQKWNQFTPGTNFVAWARKIARFEFLASVDPSRRRLVSLEADIIESAFVTLQETSEGLALKRESLRQCLQNLQGKGRRTVELRYGQGLSCPIVARRLGLSLNALYILLTRVRQVLKECVDRKTSVQGA